MVIGQLDLIPEAVVVLLGAHEGDAGLQVAFDGHVETLQPVLSSFFLVGAEWVNDLVEAGAGPGDVLTGKPFVLVEDSLQRCNSIRRCSEGENSTITPGLFNNPITSVLSVVLFGDEYSIIT